MNITFLVGNGFDIAAKIDTSYEKFYDWYGKKKSEIDHINKFRQTIKDDIKNGGKNWSDLEIGLGQHTKNYTIDNVSEFIECYEDVHEMIIKFIEEQKAQFNLEEIPENEISLFKDGIVNFYQDLNPQEKRIINEIIDADRGNDTKINFLSFNYTNTLDNIVSKISQSPLHQWTKQGSLRKMTVNKNIVHMHGTSNAYPVLGVDNATQIANQDLLSIPNFAEVMIKPQSVNAIGELWHTEAKTLISQSKIIGIFGMSLGESDATWWQSVLKWLKADSTRHLIVYWYTRNPPNGISIVRKLEETKKAKDKLFSYLQLTDEELKNVQPRVHIAINTTKVLNLHLQKVEPQQKNDEIIAFDGGAIMPDPDSFAAYDGVGKEKIIA